MANNGNNLKEAISGRRNPGFAEYALPEESDCDLLLRYERGDGQALESLLDRYESPLFHFLLGILRNFHQAEDALQETWCRALQNMDQFDKSRFRGWLFTVAYNQAMLVKRKQKGKTPVDFVHQVLLDPAPSPVTVAQEQEEAARLKGLLSRLSPNQQEVIHQRIFEGKSFREIAHILNCPVNTALARMHEGLKKLRRLWGTDYV